MKLISLSFSICLITLNSHAQLVDNFKAHTIYLSSDELKGRGTGSEGIKLAAEYISSQFKSIGLQPLADKSYFQYFWTSKLSLRHQIALKVAKTDSTRPKLLKNMPKKISKLS